MSSFSSNQRKVSSTPSTLSHDSVRHLPNAAVMSTDSSSTIPSRRSSSSTTASILPAEYSLAHVVSMTRDMLFCTVNNDNEPAFPAEVQTENGGIEIGEEESLRHGYQLARV